MSREVIEVLIMFCLVGATILFVSFAYDEWKDKH